MSKAAPLSEVKARAIAAGIAAGLVSAMAILTLSHGRAEAKPISLTMRSASSEVMSIERSAEQDPVGARKRIMTLYRSNGLGPGMDFTCAARIIARSSDREDILMAHDLAIAGLAGGDASAGQIVAETEDRLFRSLGLEERFGPQGGKKLPLTELHRRMVTKPSPMLRPMAVMSAN